MPEIHRAEPCGCRHPTCSAWHVSPCAAVQSVRFSEEQARAVAALLNAMEMVRQPIPTEPGWYYARPSLAAVERPPQPTKIHRLGDQLFVIGNTVTAPLDYFHWFGTVPQIGKK